jgi:hypothetical protein
MAFGGSGFMKLMVIITVHFTKINLNKAWGPIIFSGNLPYKVIWLTA